MFGLRLIGAVLILGIGANVLERLRFSALPQTRQTEDLLRERTPTPHGYSLFYGVAREKMWRADAAREKPLGHTLCRSDSPDCAPRVWPHAALPKRNQPAHVHVAGQPHQDFEVRLYARTVCRLAHHLHIAKGVGDGAEFLLEACSRKNHIGKRRGLGEEEILQDKERVFEAGGFAPRHETGFAPTTSSAPSSLLPATSIICAKGLPVEAGRPAYSANVSGAATGT